MLNSKLVIVTVSFNSGRDLKRTYKSIRNYLSIDCNWLILDGNSSDVSINVFDELRSNSYIKLISEEDNGIYDAMNKSLNLCDKNSYIWFLNSGDRLVCNPLTLKLKNNVNFFSIICGDFNKQVNPNIKLPFSVKSMSPFSKYPHQGMIVKNFILQKYRFDLNIGLCADHLLTLKIINNEDFKVQKEVIAWYDINGISNRRPLKMLWFNIKICKRFKFSILSYLLINNDYVLKQLIKSLLGIDTINFFRKIYKNK